MADDRGRLLPVVHDVLDAVAAGGMVLASGHASPTEAITLFGEAASRGVRRMVATHPTGRATPEQMAEMVSLGAYVELTMLACMPSVGRSTPGEMAETARRLGVSNCVVTTDFGQWMNPPPAEGMRMAVAHLLDAGLDESEVSALVRENPAALLDG